MFAVVSSYASSTTFFEVQQPPSILDTSSDGISSVAYATQQIVLALGAAGLWITSETVRYTNYTLLISATIALLLAIVVTSYWQTVFAYPKGGGSYIVSKDNLGTLPGLVAAAALRMDYVLTVAVS